jgi:hypothetical protein
MAGRTALFASRGQPDLQPDLGEKPPSPAWPAARSSPGQQLPTCLAGLAAKGGVPRQLAPASFQQPRIPASSGSAGAGGSDLPQHRHRHPGLPDAAPHPAPPTGLLQQRPSAVTPARSTSRGWSRTFRERPVPPPPLSLLPSLQPDHSAGAATERIRDRHRCQQDCCHQDTSQCHQDTSQQPSQPTRPRLPQTDRWSGTLPPGLQHSAGRGRGGSEVENRGLEPLTSAVRSQRSTS